MSGNWGNLDCPQCGHTHPRPDRATTDCDAVVAELICPDCRCGWEVRVELWRYYGVPEDLPSREQDR